MSKDIHKLAQEILVDCFEKRIRQFSKQIYMREINVSLKLRTRACDEHISIVVFHLYLYETTKN